jgi:hypothetical protein
VVFLVIDFRWAVLATGFMRASTGFGVTPPSFVGIDN